MRLYGRIDPGLYAADKAGLRAYEKALKLRPDEPALLAFKGALTAINENEEDREIALSRYRDAVKACDNACPPTVYSIDVGPDDPPGPEDTVDAYVFHVRHESPPTTDQWHKGFLGLYGAEAGCEKDLSPSIVLEERSPAVAGTAFAEVYCKSNSGSINQCIGCRKPSGGYGYWRKRPNMWCCYNSCPY
jgi:hypothetical protein